MYVEEMKFYSLKSCFLFIILSCIPSISFAQLRGDVNDDGKVNAADIVTIVKIMMEDQEKDPNGGLYQDTSELLSEFNIDSEVLNLDGVDVIHYTMSPENIPFITPIRSVFRVPNIVMSNAEDFVVAVENREIANDRAERDIVLGHFNKMGQFKLKRIWKEKAVGRYNNPTFIIQYLVNYTFNCLKINELH